MAALIKQIEFGNMIVTISAGIHCMETCVRRRRGLLGSGALVQGVFGEADLIDLVRAVRLAYHFVKRDETIGAARGSPLYTRSSIVRGAWIINEAHGLRAQTVRALKTLLEPIPDHMVFIFTTTRAEEGLLFDGAEDARPLVGRCTPVPLNTQGLAKPAARWLRNIAQAEGLDGKPESAYVRLFNDSSGSFREALQAIDAGAMLGNVTEGQTA